METKKSKVTAIAENVSQYAGQNGTIYYHKVTFENGDSGQYGSKTPNCEKFKIGQEADYSKETKQNGNYINVIIKPIQPQGQGGSKFEPKNQKAIIAQSSLANAVALCKDVKPCSDDDVFKLAERMFNWVCEKGGIQ